MKIGDNNRNMKILFVRIIVKFLLTTLDLLKMLKEKQPLKNSCI